MIDKDGYQIVEDYDEWRNGIFSNSSADSSPLPEGERVWSVLIETGLVAGDGDPDMVFSLRTLANGSADLYLSTGGGLILEAALDEDIEEDEGELNDASSAAQALVLYADDFLDSCVSATKFPLPTVGHVRFYLFTRDGVLTTEVFESTLNGQEHPFSPLHNTAHALLAEMRALNESDEDAEDDEDDAV